MISYELAKKLKDIGFPQRAGLHGDDLKSHIKFGFPIYGCEHNKENCDCGTHVFYPKLGELIEACEPNDFFRLVMNFEFDPTKNSLMPFWRCRDKRIEAESIEGNQTPEEAVAQFYIKLSDKKS